MRTHLAALGLSALASILLMACAADPGTPEASDEELRARPVNAQEAEQLFDLVDDNCAGNDNGNFRRFEVATFNAGEVMSKVKDDDRDAMGVGCFGDHAYSNSKANAIEMFNKHLADNEWDDRTCLEEHLSRQQITRLKAMVADPSNLGVFASVYDGHGEGNSEACAFYTFHVYRADGVHVKLTFNHTD